MGERKEHEICAALGECLPTLNTHTHRHADTGTVIRTPGIHYDFPLQIAYTIRIRIHIHTQFSHSLALRKMAPNGAMPEGMRHAPAQWRTQNGKTAKRGK